MIFLLKFMTAGTDLSVMLKCSVPVFFAKFIIRNIIFITDIWSRFSIIFFRYNLLK